MKEACEFVSIGITNKKFDDELTEIRCFEKHIQSNNGYVYMSHPLDKTTLGNFSVSSNKLLAALKNCEWDPKIKITDSNIILNKDNKRFQLPINNELKYFDLPGGKYKKVKPGLINVIKSLFPLISEDASRPWSQTMCVNDGYVYVTNNVIIGRQPYKMKNCLLPIQVLSAMIKVNKDPVKVQIRDQYIVFVYENDSWILGKLPAEGWPKEAFLVYDIYDEDNMKEFSDTFKSGINSMSGFVTDDVVVFEGGILKTVNDSVVVRDIKQEGKAAFSYTMIKKVIENFHSVDFSCYPSPMSIKSDSTEGLFVGMIF